MDSIIQTLDETGVPWETILLAVMAVLGFLLAVLVLDQIIQAILRFAIGRRYSVRIPFSVRVGVDFHTPHPGSLVMGYPYWRRAKKDGTRDLRTNDRHVVKERTVIRFDGWKLRGKDPFEAYDLVMDLRRGGQVIAPCYEEQQKRSYCVSRAKDRQAATNIDGIIATFADRPTDFEDFCADMFRQLGYTAKVTPPSRDGGYDILLRGQDGVTSIAECKCYARNHHVGRPIVQKLHGANATVGAQGMMVITTSSFSQGAIEYAARTGVQLIDGSRLVEMCRNAWPSVSASSPLMISTNEITLTDDDIMACIPMDLQARYR